MYTQPDKTLLSKTSFRVTFGIGSLFALGATGMRFWFFIDFHWSIIIIIISLIFTLIALILVLVLLIITKKHRRSR